MGSLWLIVLALGSAHALSYTNFSGWPASCTGAAQPTPIALSTAGLQPTVGGALSFRGCDNFTQLWVSDSSTGPHLHADGCAMMHGGVTFALQRLEIHVPAEFTVDGRRSAMAIYASFVEEGSSHTTVVALPLTNDAAAPRALPTPSGWAGLFFSMAGRNTAPTAALTPSPPVGLTVAVEGAPYLSVVGSLTTPPCAAAVEWLIVRNPLFVPRDVVAAAYTALSSSPTVSLSPTMGNARPTAPLGPRTVTLWTGTRSRSTPTHSTSSTGTVVAAIAVVMAVVFAIVFVLHRWGVIDRLWGPTAPAPSTFAAAPTIGLGEATTAPTGGVVKY